MHKSSTDDYMIRNENREGAMADAVITLVEHYVGLGDTVEVANDKVDQVSYELRHPTKSNLNYAIDGYATGSALCKTDLKNGIDAIDEVVYPFFTATEKTIMKDALLM